MHVRRTLLLLPLLIVVFTLIYIPAASAARKASSKKRVEIIQEQINKAKASLDSAEADSDNAQLEAQATDVKLRANEVRLAYIDNRLTALKNDASHRTLFGYKLPSARHLSALVFSRDTRDFMLRLSVLTATFDRKAKEAQQLAHAKKKLTLFNHELLVAKKVQLRKLKVAQLRHDSLKDGIDSNQAVMAELTRSQQRYSARSRRVTDRRYAVAEVRNTLSRSFTSRGGVRSSFVFPVVGPHHFIDSWGFRRSGGRGHKGTDIMAAHGTPVVACVSGTIKKARPYSYSLGGITIWLDGDDGNTYYYAHLQSITAGITDGVRVNPGQIIAAVGSTGNASASAPHLHFEMHPGGGGAIDPYSTLVAADR